MLKDHLISWPLRSPRSGERSFSRGGIGANFVYDKLVFKKVQRGTDWNGGLVKLMAAPKGRTCEKKAIEI